MIFSPLRSICKRSYRTPFIQRLFRREVEIESDTATIVGPERTFRSKSSDTKEHLIDGDEADRQVVNSPSDRNHVPSYHSLDDVYGVNYRGVEGSAPQPWPKMSSKYAEAIRQIPSDIQRGYDEFYGACPVAVNNVDVDFRELEEVKDQYRKNFEKK